MSLIPAGTVTGIRHAYLVRTPDGDEQDRTVVVTGTWPADLATEAPGSV